MGNADMGKVYQPGALEQALNAVSRATELATGYIQRSSLLGCMDEGLPLDGALPDLSPEGACKRGKIGAQVRDLLAGVDDEKLPHELALTAKLLRHYADAWVKDGERYWLAVDMNSALFHGPFSQTAYTGGYYFNGVRQVLGQFRFERDGDGERYQVVLADIARLLRQMHERSLGQAERGIRIQKPQLPGARALLAGLRASAAATFTVPAERLKALPAAQALEAEIRRRVEQQILPGFDALIAQLDEDYEAKAPAEVGMSQLPGGREVYADLVRMHTTMDLTPEQVHAAGHARMARIEAESVELRKTLGFEGDAPAFAAYMRARPGVAAASPEDIGERMRRHKDRFEARFDEFFTQRAPSDYDMERLPQALEGSMTWGYYSPPVGDEKRGLYYYNGSRLDSLAVLGAGSLVFHELVPGHHLESTLAQTNKNLPPLRQAGMVNAYAEGWAEYAATLAGEMGLYDDPQDRYGRLVMDAFLTSRLVVDTGMNTLGWTWEQAKDYMRKHTLCAEGEIVSDTLRYSCGIPGQALAYKLGDEAILRMRDKVRAKVGAGFDLRHFHSAVLGTGRMPLPVLEWHLAKVYGLEAA